MAMPARVAHIDPEPDYRLLVGLALGPSPAFEVVAEAGDLADAPALVEAHRPDVVLVEPHVHGSVDAAGLAALHTASPGMRLVVLSALPAGALGRSALQAGSIGYLSKSVRPTALADELDQLLGVLRLVEVAVSEAHTDLDNDLISPRRARQFVTQTLERWDCGDATTIIDLLVSELVANAVMHAGTSAELTVQLLDDRVRVAVTDGDTSQPKRRSDDPTSSSGRGIALIEHLSLAWGIDRMPTGKRIWFETPRPA